MAKDESALGDWRAVGSEFGQCLSETRIAADYRDLGELDDASGHPKEKFSTEAEGSHAWRYVDSRRVFFGLATVLFINRKDG